MFLSGYVVGCLQDGNSLALLDLVSLSRFLTYDTFYALDLLSVWSTRQVTSLSFITLVASNSISFVCILKVADKTKDEPIKLRVALQQQNLALFEQTVLEVSTPDHPKYGKHMEGHEIKAMLKPTQAASDAVISWLQDHNITNIEDDGDWVNFKTNVATANKILDTEFQWYVSGYEGKVRLRTLQYSVPDEVAQHINLVQPTTRFGQLKPMRSLILKKEYEGRANGVSRWAAAAARKSGIDVACNTTITPQCLLQLYNVHYKAPANTTSKVAFASFLEEYARYADLARFETEYAPYAVGQNFSVVSINGGLNDQLGTEDSGEANLDLQYIVGVSSPVPVTEFSTAGRG